MGEGTRIYDTDGNYTVFGLLGRNLLGSELACLAGCSDNLADSLNNSSQYAGWTEGTSSALTATTPNPFTLDVGSRIIVKLHTDITGSPTTLSVNGGYAAELNRATPAGFVYLTSGNLVAGMVAEFVYDGYSWNITSPYILSNEDLSADQYVVAGGTANARTASPANPWTSYVDGKKITIYVPTNNSGSCTLNVSGLGAKTIYKPTQAGGGLQALSSGELMGDCPSTLIYSTASNGFVLLSPWRLLATEIPSTLNATTFAGVVTINHPDIQLNSIRGYSDSGTMTVEQGQSSGGAHLKLYGLNHPTKPSRMEYILRNASGAAHSFFDKNGTEQLKIDENGAWTATIRSLPSGGNLTIWSGNNSNITISAGNSALPANGATLYLGGTGDTYPGAHQQYAPLVTRTASTAFAVCPVATGDSAVIELFSGSGNGVQVVIHVDSSGNVTLHNPDGVAYNTAYVVTSSPGASYIGIYWLAGVVYIKPGSDFTGGSAIKIATFSKIAKA